MLLLPPFPSDATATAWRDVVKTLPTEPTLRFAAREKPPAEPAVAARATAVLPSPSIYAGENTACGVARGVVRDGEVRIISASHEAIAMRHLSKNISSIILSVDSNSGLHYRGKWKETLVASSVLGNIAARCADRGALLLLLLFM